MATQQHRTDPRTGRIDGRADGHHIGTHDEPQMRDLLKQLATEGGDLVRNELSLAKLEMRDMAREVALDSAKLFGAIGLAIIGGLALTAAAIIGLGWLLGGQFGLAALIVGALMLLIGGVMARAGVQGLKHVPKPEATMASMERNREWASREIREFREEIRS